MKRLACSICHSPIEKGILGNLYCPTCEPEAAEALGSETIVTCPGCNHDITAHFNTYPQLLFGLCPDCGYRLGRYILKLT